MRRAELVSTRDQPGHEDSSKQKPLDASVQYHDGYDGSYQHDKRDSRRETLHRGARETGSQPPDKRGAPAFEHGLHVAHRPPISVDRDSPCPTAWQASPSVFPPPGPCPALASSRCLLVSSGCDA